MYLQEITFEKVNFLRIYARTLMGPKSLTSKIQELLGFSFAQHINMKST